MGTGKACPRCGRELEPSDVAGYRYVCPDCDENFYSFEAGKPRHSIVLSVYMTVEAETKEEAFGKAETTVEALFEKAIANLDRQDGFNVENWFCDWTQR